MASPADRGGKNPAVRTTNKINLSLSHVTAVTDAKSRRAILVSRPASSEEGSTKRAHAGSSGTKDDVIVISSGSEGEQDPPQASGSIRRVRRRLTHDLPRARSPRRPAQAGSADAVSKCKGADRKDTARKAVGGRSVLVLEPGEMLDPVLLDEDGQRNAEETKFDQDLADAQTVITTLRAKLSAEKQHTAELYRRLHAGTADLAEAHDELADLTARLSDKTTGLIIAEKELDELREQLVSTRAALDVANVSLADKSAMLDSLNTRTAAIKEGIEKFLECGICYEPAEDGLMFACGHGFVHVLCFELMMRQLPRDRDGNLKGPPVCPYCREVIASRPVRVFVLGGLTELAGGEPQETRPAAEYAWMDEFPWGEGAALGNVSDRDDDGPLLPAGFVPAAAAPDDPADSDYQLSERSSDDEDDAAGGASNAGDVDDDAEDGYAEHAGGDGHGVVPLLQWPRAAADVVGHYNAGELTPAVRLQEPLRRFNRWSHLASLEPRIPPTTIDLLTGGREELLWDGWYAHLRALCNQADGEEEDRYEAKIARQCRRMRLARLSEHLPRLAAAFAFDRGERDVVHAAPLTGEQLDLLTGDEEELLLTVRRNAVAELAPLQAVGKMHSRIGRKVRARLEKLQPYLPLLDLQGMRELPPYIRRDGAGVLHLVNV